MSLAKVITWVTAIVFALVLGAARMLDTPNDRDVTSDAVLGLDGTETMLLYAQLAGRKQ